MIELALGLFLAFGAYAYGTKESKTKEPEFNIELCAKSCDKLSYYNDFKKECVCQKSERYKGER